MTYRVAFVGAQTGDDGKGVRVDYYAKKAVNASSKEGAPKVWTMRWQGGANAGHTVYLEGKRYALHQIPSAILLDRTYNLMGEGVFLEPRACLNEIEDLRRRGLKIDSSNFGIASNAHVTLDYHIEMDAGCSRKSVGHTSTGRGVKQTAVDKYGRNGIRFAEFLDLGSFVEALKVRFPDGMPDGRSHWDFARSYLPQIQGLREFSVLQERVLSNKGYEFGIGEGAQGFMLDVDRGLYPGVTSSNPSMPPFRADKVVGVVKAYASSIGEIDLL
jgi:adenylosuccinate synthase